MRARSRSLSLHTTPTPTHPTQTSLERCRALSAGRVRGHACTIFTLVGNMPQQSRRNRGNSHALTRRDLHCTDGLRMHCTLAAALRTRQCGRGRYQNHALAFSKGMLAGREQRLCMLHRSTATHHTMQRCSGVRPLASCAFGLAPYSTFRKVSVAKSKVPSIPTSRYRIQ